MPRCHDFTTQPPALPPAPTRTLTHPPTHPPIHPPIHARTHPPSRRLSEVEGTATEQVGGVVNDWAITQSTGFGGQLGCGARAFDVRPYQKDDGSIIMHHGDVKVGE